MSAPDGRVVLLTGAAQGIGRATAAALAARGYRLGLLDLAARPLLEHAEALRAIAPAVAAEAVDVRDREALRASVERIEAAVGPIAILVACAGVGGLTSIKDLDMPGFRAALEVNVLGVAQTIEAVLPGMIARHAGHIVGISSVAGYRGLPWMAGYSASKAAIATYLEALRPILKPRGVSITTVYPCFVRTGMTVSTPFRRPVPMLEPDQAAAYMVRAIERRPRDYSFPPSSALAMKVLRGMPNRMFDWLMDYEGPRALTTEF
jgi:short-subunit dehydrogenase